ncbi:Pex24p-domain-containing protein [Saitoella complicata NRRL Y-17804]|nr:Pex24p-domain-containing protein [Saitoella complicata NRRL Y-17804]ODQ53697.1 Pex24p-domain-containing protein [Saitoella complicata NRRL Y-17804]
MKQANQPKRTYAVFSTPDSDQDSAVSTTKRASLSTDPAVIRALARAGPLIDAVNVVLACITWTHDAAYSSFLVVCGWTVFILYADFVLVYGLNLIPISWIIWTYLRRNAGRRRRSMVEVDSAPKTTTQIDLDRISEQTDLLYARLALIREPLYRLISFLDWTKNPGTTYLIAVRLACLTPIWFTLVKALFAPRMVVLVLGLVFFTWFSVPTKTIRQIMWRNPSVRRLASVIVGVDFEIIKTVAGVTRAREGSIGAPPGLIRVATFQDKDYETVRFKHIVWENQRRWIGLGWTANLFPHERSPWTDDYGETCADLKSFKLPDEKILPVAGNKVRVAKWNWVPNEEWKTEVTKDSDADGWVYTDNKWRNPTPREEFGKYTRRRKWYRHADLFEEVREFGVIAPTEDAKSETAEEEATVFGAREAHEHAIEVALEQALSEESKASDRDSFATVSSADAQVHFT